MNSAAAVSQTGKFALALALFLLVAPASPLRATVLVDLDLSGDTAANSGTWGNGIVNLNGLGYWTTDAAGNAVYNTGASAMGSTGGTISWNRNGTTGVGNMDGMTAFSMYAWVSPETLFTGGRIASYNGSASWQVLGEENTGNGQMRLDLIVNGTQKYVYFGDATGAPLGTGALNQWLFIGVSYDNGSADLYVGLAGSADLSSGSIVGLPASLPTGSSSGLTLLNTNAASTGTPRSFDGSLGAFYLSDQATDAAAMEAFFDASKGSFDVVPEAPSLAPFAVGAGGLLLLFHRRKFRLQG